MENDLNSTNQSPVSMPAVAIVQHRRGRLWAGIVLMVIIAAAAIYYWKDTHKELSVLSESTTMDLKTQLETVYNSVREALHTKNYEKFSTLEQPGEGERALTQEEFMSYASDLEDMGTLDALYPELSNVRFIAVKQNDDWAGYYYQSDLNNPMSVTVGVYKFKQVDGKWRMLMTQVTSGWIKGSSKTPEQEIETEPRFQLP